MTVYIKNKDALNELKEVPFKLERDLQNLVENNLSELLGLELVQSEFALKERRFDTLAFDQQTQSFVIIEYKRSRHFSVIDQGMTYLGILLENKAECVLAYQENCKKPMQKNSVNWSATRVIFVSSGFTDFQVGATFQDLPIELLEVKQYEGDIVILNPIKKVHHMGGEKTSITKNNAFENVAKQLKVYTEEDHLRTASPEIKELYEELKEAILSLDNRLHIQCTGKYIAFKIKSNITDIVVCKNALKIYVNAKKGTLDEPKKLFQDVSNIGAWGNGDYCVKIVDDSQLEYILSVIKQIL